MEIRRYGSVHTAIKEVSGLSLLLSTSTMQDIKTSKDGKTTVLLLCPECAKLFIPNVDEVRMKIMLASGQAMADANVGTLAYNIIANDLTKAGTAAAKGNFEAMGIAISTRSEWYCSAINMFTAKYEGYDAKVQAISQNSGIASSAIYDMGESISKASNGNDSLDDVTTVMDKLSNAGVTNETADAG